jgi:peptidoglycan-associated lipoprotein
MKIIRIGVIVLIAALAASACSSKGGSKPGEEGMEGSMGAAGAGGPEIGKYGEGAGGMYGGAGAGGRYGANGAYGAGAQGGMAGDAALNDPSSPLYKRVIYFQYDSSEVQPEYLYVVNNHANYLASNPSKSLVLEGHADERGSPEYNIALGEQRAKAVAKLMQLQGVAENQIQVVSYGEEKPAVQGHDDSAWQQNRRVEISYPGQ